MGLGWLLAKGCKSNSNLLDALNEAEIMALKEELASSIVFLNRRDYMGSIAHAETVSKLQEIDMDFHADLPVVESQQLRLLQKQLVEVDDMMTEMLLQARLGKPEIGVLTKPPRYGEMAFWFVLDHSKRERLLGDLEEDFGKLAEKYGASWARRWYWWQVCRSVIVGVGPALLRLMMLKELVERISR